MLFEYHSNIEKPTVGKSLSVSFGCMLDESLVRMSWTTGFVERLGSCLRGARSARFSIVEENCQENRT
jgi:hypothetical protein